jgi:hypothetical protein
MRSSRRLLALLAVATMVAACGTPAAPPPTPPPASIAVVRPSHAATPRPTVAPPASATEAASLPPAPSPTAIGHTKTPWGTILDAVPDTFAVFPDATPADPLPAAVSGAWITAASVDEVATWYHDAVINAGFASADLGGPLEDGSRVLDIRGDLPECKVQVTVQPAGGSTMIIVRYGAGCAGGES